MIVLDGSWEDWPVSPGPTAVTVGVLDGVHLGHRALLAKLDPRLVRSVLTFDPHPVEVLRPGTPARLISTLDERIALLLGLGIERVGVLDLGEIKEQSPRSFVTDVLIGRFAVSQLVIGEDFRFGRDRTGDVDLLLASGEEFGFRVDAIPMVGAGEMPVSSSRIRRLIDEGDVAGAAELLGSRYTLSNVVIDGDKRGRTIGFPTANLKPPDRKLIPGHGVYACFADIGGAIHQAAVNVGVRPTFGGDELLIEAYILDFDDDIYGTEIRLEFVQHLRQELAFDSIEALVEAMNDDVDATRAILGATRSQM